MTPAWRVWYAVRRPGGYRLAAPIAIAPARLVWIPRSTYTARHAPTCGQQRPNQLYPSQRCRECGFAAVLALEDLQRVWRLADSRGRARTDFKRRTGMEAAATVIGRVHLLGTVTPGQPMVGEVRAWRLRIDQLFLDEDEVGADLIADSLADAYGVPVTLEAVQQVALPPNHYSREVTQ